MSAPGFQSWREGDLWVIDVPGYGITQAETEADCARMAADLVEQTRAAKIAEFEAAPDDEDSLRERVARATYDLGAPMSEWPWAPDPVRSVFRARADAAIKVMRGDDA